MTSHTQNTANVRNENDIKASVRTLEFVVYVLAVIATIITAAVVGDDARENGVDVFDAAQAMQYIVFLTVGLMVARGLAKAGNRFNNNNNNGRNS